MGFTTIGGGVAAMPVNLGQFTTTGGFGQGAYDRARAAGYSDAQIKQSLPSSGLKIGERVGQTLGGNTSLYQYRGEGKGLGMGTLQRAQAAGMSNAQIRSAAASSGMRIGELAAQALNVNPGMTYLGLAPGIQASYEGNVAGPYPARPNLAPAGYGMDGRFGSSEGYSPTLYISGGENDYDAMNFIFGTDYQGGPDIGGGYSDPYFNIVNAGGAYTSGGMPFGMNPAMAAFNAIMSRYGMPTDSNVAKPAPQPSFGSAGATRNNATAVRTAGTPGSGTTYNTMNRAGSTGLSIGGLNV
tara:strand:+ start:204 stop:1097 length:894 start_codon:yes stop_codon:yes gene_type:complete